MSDVEGFVLAGGASRRMGSDKARLRINGVTLVEKVAQVLQEVTAKVSTVGQSFEDTDLKHVTDVYPGWGALGGLHAALSACKANWMFVVACDLPFITSELLERLIRIGRDCDAAVPIQPDSIPQPLCACYRTDVCLKVAEKLIKSGKRRPLDLLSMVETRWVPFSEIEDLDHSSQFFVNINTPADYDEATRTAVGTQN